VVCGGRAGRELIWRRGRPTDEAAGIKCPGEEEASSPRLGLREFALPWVLLSMIDDLVEGKARLAGRGAAAAC
jgi:hypothetical protein